MPQTKKAKQLKAIAAYEAAIRLHESSLESAEFRLKGYNRTQAAGDKDPLIAQVIEAVKEQMAREKDKVTKLKDHILHTSQAFGYGNRGAA